MRAGVRIVIFTNKCEKRRKWNKWRKSKRYLFRQFEGGEGYQKSGAFDPETERLVKFLRAGVTGGGVPLEQQINQ
jgi:hypothetical protein